MKKHLFNYLKGITTILFFMAFVLTFNTAEARVKKDLILVLDTSLSMVGHGGENILPKVKESLNKFIDQLESGDTLTFITFDEETRPYPLVYVEDKNDKDILKKYISMVEAHGKWTYTFQMYKSVYDLTVNLDQQNPDREKVIIVCTDGVDDPPPMIDGKKLEIKDIATDKKEWYVYVLDLGNKATQEKIARLTGDIKKNLTPNVKVMQGSDTDKMIATDLPSDIKSNVVDKNRKYKITGFAALVLLLILAVIYLLRKEKGFPVTGKFEYWNHELLDPYIYTADLSNFHVKKLAVGKSSDCTLKIRELASKSPVGFVLSGVKSGNEVVVKLQVVDQQNFIFVNREAGDVLQDGDMIKVSNYTFKYFK